MNLLEYLKAEAAKRGLIKPEMELDPAKVFELVRDMPYARATSRDPEVTIREWRGTCSGKHYLLKAVFAELGLRSHVMACSTELVVEPKQVPAELRSILADAGGRIVDIHNYLVVELPGGEMIVDATWPLEMKSLGFNVNETFIPGESQQMACRPIERWVVPEDKNPQQFKTELLSALFTAEELEHRDNFIRTFSRILAQRD